MTFGFAHDGRPRTGATRDRTISQGQNSGLLTPTYAHTLMAGDDRFRLFSPSGPQSGVGNLTTSLTIAGAVVAPTFFGVGSQANATNWVPTVGETLLANGSGGSFNIDSPMLTPGEYGVDPGGTRYWLGQNASFGDITTEDFIFECVVRNVPATADQRLFRKAGGGGSWVFRFNTNTFNAFMSDGVGSANISASTVELDSYAHAMFFADRSGSGIWYVNGVQSGSGGALTGTAGSLSATGVLSCCANDVGSAIVDTPVLQLGLWIGSGILDTHLQASLAAERFQRLCGFYPALVKGTGVWDSMTRASSAMLERQISGEQKLFRMGRGWPRASHNHIGKGYYSELGATNLALYSEELDDATWTKTNTTITADSHTAPDGETTADTINEDGTASALHHVEQSITLTAGTTYIISATAYADNRTWFAIQDVTDGDGSFFDASNAVLGAVIGTPGDRGIRSIGTNKCHAWIKVTPGSTGAKVIRLSIADADNSLTFNGLSQASLQFWGIQVEAGVDYPSSYIRTTGATASRSDDALTYDADSVAAGQGQLIVSAATDYDVDSTFSRVLGTITNGGSSANRIFLRCRDSNDSAQVLTTASGGNAGNVSGTIDVADGTIRQSKTTWRENDLRLFVDNVEDGTADTVVDIPAGLDEITVGSDEVGSNQPNMLITEFTVRK